MAFQSERWATIQVTAGNLEGARQYQQLFLDKKYAPKADYNVLLKLFQSKAKGWIQGGVITALGYLSFPTGVFATVATLCTSMIDVIGKQAAATEYDQLIAGRKAVEEVKSYISKNNYKMAEVTFRLRTYENPATGHRVSFFLGNSKNISVAYEIKRVQLQNGKWLEK